MDYQEHQDPKREHTSASVPNKVKIALVLPKAVPICKGLQSRKTYCSFKAFVSLESNWCSDHKSRFPAVGPRIESSVCGLRFINFNDANG